MLTKYEYKFVDVNSAKAEQLLGELSANGWSVVGNAADKIVLTRPVGDRYPQQFIDAAAKISEKLLGGSPLQAMVRQFHEAMGMQVGVTPLLRDSALRAELIREEAEETVEAIDKGDLPAAVDGLCDLIYVCLGAAVAWGVDLAPIFKAVHEANMAKVGGPKRADGKHLKPEGWKPPDIVALLNAQGAKL